MNDLEEFTNKLRDFLFNASAKLILIAIILAVGFVFVNILTNTVKKLLSKSDRL
ncbi:MAG: hypothetical protein IIZ36_02940, partial [Ruminococcus sp.]|nr:hypothetical protein [Ruminococcus sp.]